VGVVKSDDGDAQRLAGSDGFPGDLVGIAGLDDIGHLALEDALDGLQPQQGAVAGGAGDEGGADGVGAGAALLGHAIGGAGDDEDVAVIGGVVVEIGGLLLEVAFHAAADGGVKLGKVADFHAAGAPHGAGRTSPTVRERLGEALTYSKWAR
jgi:hypothetical protein